MLGQSPTLGDCPGLFYDCPVTRDCIDIRSDTLPAVGEGHGRTADNVDARRDAASPKALVEFVEERSHCTGVELEGRAVVRARHDRIRRPTRKGLRAEACAGRPVTELPGPSWR